MDWSVDVVVVEQMNYSNKINLSFRTKKTNNLLTAKNAERVIANAQKRALFRLNTT